MKFGGTAKLMGLPAGRYDGHVHVFDQHLPMPADRRYTPARSASLDELSDLLKAHCMDGALLVQPSFLGSDNSFLMSALQAGRAIAGLHYRGVAMTSPDTPADELQRLADSGVVGMRLNLVGRPLPALKSPEWRAHLRDLRQLGWHLELHLESDRLIDVLNTLVEQMDTVVVDHFGLPAAPFSCPEASLAPLLRMPKERLMVKLSAPYRFMPEIPAAAYADTAMPMVEQLTRHLGAERLIWGSDWPWTQNEVGRSYEETLDWAARWERAVR